MTRVVLSSVLCLSLGLLGQVAMAQDTSKTDGDVIVTSGDGVVTASADEAYVTVTVESRAKLPRDAQRANAQIMTAVQEKLKGAGIPQPNIKTLSVELHPEFDYNNGKQTLRGYVARNSVEIKVEQLERSGEIADLAVAAGATSLGNIRFDIKNRDEVERKALAAAVADARSRAEALAQGAGRTIDRIIRIEDHGEQSGYQPPRPMMAMRSAEMADAPTPVNAGPLEVRARVALTVRLK